MQSKDEAEGNFRNMLNIGGATVAGICAAPFCSRLVHELFNNSAITSTATMLSKPTVSTAIYLTADCLMNYKRHGNRREYARHLRRASVSYIPFAAGFYPTVFLTNYVLLESGLEPAQAAAIAYAAGTVTGCLSMVGYSMCKSKRAGAYQAGLRELGKELPAQPKRETVRWK